jgi:hypothetical protein
LKAWSRLVHTDSTFVVFNCGNYERIGLRHRASQTLYLSELIDVPHCKSPGYGKIHVGLYMAIIHDLFDRTRVRKKQAGGPTQNRKRRRGSNDALTTEVGRKRPRTRGAVIKDKAEEEQRQIALQVLPVSSDV